MTEQYIYSRSEREFVNALGQTIPLGFGFMALSPGMDNSLKRDVAVHCEDCPRLSQTDSQGIPLPLFRKTLLPKGQVLFQKSAWIEKGSRDFHVAHGYVLDAEAVKNAGPAKWLGAAFRLEDPNTVPGGIPPLESRLELSERKPQKFHDLTDAALGLNNEQFCQMLLACFDALASRRQVLIAWDFERPGEQDLRRSVLYWIYTFLPHDLRTRLGFDSVYTDKSSPGLVQLAFVDVASIRDSGLASSIQLGNQIIPLRGNFLIRDGEIIHNDSKYKTEWYLKDSTYANFLGNLVKIVWKCPEDKREAVIRTLGDTQQSLQRQMPSRLEEKQLDPEDYRKACEPIYQLRDLREAAGLDKPKPTAGKHKAPPEKHEPSPKEVYRRIFQRRMQSPSAKDLQDLAGIRGEMKSAAIGLLSAFMVREADAPEAGVSAVLRRYKEQLPPNVYAQLPRRMFFDELDAVDRDIWIKCGVKSGVDAAEQRRCKWYTEIVAAYDAKEDLTSYFRKYLNGLPGISGEQRVSMEEECFQGLLNRIWARHTIPAYPGDIQLLASMCGGSAGTSAVGFLGALMAQAADTPWMPLYMVLRSFQGLLPPGIYSQLLFRLFWNELTDMERSVWNSCGVQNSEIAAKLRRVKWYREIAPAYNRAEDVTSFVMRSLNILPGIDGQFRVNMENELQMIVKMTSGLP